MKSVFNHENERYDHKRDLIIILLCVETRIYIFCLKLSWNMKHEYGCCLCLSLI